MTVDEILTELRHVRREVVTGSGLNGEVSSYLMGRLCALIRSIEQRSSPRLISISLNEYVRFRVTARGRELLKSDARYQGPQPDDDGMVELPFNLAIGIFGPTLMEFTRPPGMSSEVEVVRGTNRATDSEMSTKMHIGGGVNP